MLSISSMVKRLNPGKDPNSSFSFTGMRYIIMLLGFAGKVKTSACHYLACVSSLKSVIFKVLQFGNLIVFLCKNI